MPTPDFYPHQLIHNLDVSIFGIRDWQDGRIQAHRNQG